MVTILLPAGCQLRHPSNCVGLVAEQCCATTWRPWSAARSRPTRWRGCATSVRGPLGEVVSRELRSAQFTTTLPGAPDGEYVVIESGTDFENKASAIETVIPMKDPDGSWRVSGYFIK